MLHYDLLVIGTGSGNSILTPDFDEWRVGMVERGVFGGTCLNRGCIPSKMLVYAADLAESARHAHTLGVHTRVERIDWPTIRDRVFDRIDPIAEAGERYRVDECPNVTVHRGEARFVGTREVHVDGELLTADHIVLAAGARPQIPDVPGLADVAYHTSDTIMRVDRVPEHLIVIGGGYIGAEMSHVFGALGSKVTIVCRSELLLRDEDDDVRLCFTDCYRHRFDVLLSTQVLTVGSENDSIRVEVSVDGEHRVLVGDALLVATGRIPNSDELDVAAGGIAVDHAGYVVTDDHLRTNVAGVWALGDITNPAQLKHTANHEAKVVAHNLVHPDDLRSARLDPVPHAVFGHPQVASAGLTERAARDAGLPYVAALRYHRDTAYGWAMEDRTGFCKLVAHRHTRQLLGAHLVGPHAPTLLQQLVQAMRFGQTVEELAHGQLWTHPAMPEVVEQALLELCTHD